MRRRYLVLLGLLAPLAVGTAALAFWTGSGTGVAHATTGTMNPPTSAAASTTAGVGTSHLTWHASTLSNGSAVDGYYATRVRNSDSVTAPACGSTPTTLVTATACDDLLVPDGTYHYVITAVFHSWTATASSNDVTVINDNTPPSVTVNQASGQADPTNAGPINFTVTFSEVVTDFDSTDVTLSGTASATTAVVTGSGTNYTVAVTGMTAPGTVLANIAAGRAHDAAANASLASTSTDNTVTYDAVAPTVTVNQKTGQLDPTKNLPVLFTVTFNEPVTGFDATDLTRAGTSTGGTVAVTGSGANYEIAVTGTPTPGTLSFTIAAGKAADLAGNTNVASTSTDNTVTYANTGPTNSIALELDSDVPSAYLSGTTLYFNGSVDSNFQLTNTVTAPLTAPASTTYPALTASGWTPPHASETITDPTGGPYTSTDFFWTPGAAVPADYTVTSADTAGNTTPTVLHFINDVTPPTGGLSYPNGLTPTMSIPVTVTPAADAGSGLDTADTSVQRAEANLLPGGACDTFGAFQPITLDGSSDTDVTDQTCYKYQYVIVDNVWNQTVIAPTNVVKIDAQPLTDGSISYLDGYTHSTSIPVTVNLGSAGVSGQVQRATATLTAGACGTFSAFSNWTTVTAVNGVTLQTVQDTGSDAKCYMYQVIVTDAFGKTVTYTSTSVAKVDTTVPTVTINQAANQANSTSVSPVNFTVVFSEAVTGFDSSDLTLSGTSTTGVGPGTATVAGNGTTYTVAVSPLKSGSVIAAIGAGKATDVAGNVNTASTSTDNTVTYTDNTKPTVTINQAASQVDPTNTPSVAFTVVFSEPVTGFTGGAITIGGTAHGNTATVSGTGPNYTVTITGMTNTGTVIPSININQVNDLSSNSNTASTSTDNTVTYTDNTPPTVTINQKSTQADPTNNLPIDFTVVFSETVTDFTSADVTLTGTATGNKAATITGSGTSYNVAVNITGTTGSGTVTVAIGAGTAHDASGNPNTASTTSDDTVTYDITKPTVTVNQATGQADPATGAPINFTVAFSEAVTGLTSGDINLGGNAPGTLVATLTGSGSTYNVAVTGMTNNGTVTASLNASKATDLAGNSNTASTSGDNVVNYADITAPVVTISSFTTSGHKATITGTGGFAPGDGSVIVTLCTTNTNPCTGTKTTLSGASVNPSTGVWTVTSGPLGNNAALYARATQSDAAGNAGASNVAGPVAS